MGITNYVLVALDQQAYEILCGQGIHTCLLPREGEVLWGQESENFGTIGFKAICNEKPFLVYEIVKDGWTVLWTDVDIVWLSDPFPHFTEADFNVQQDDDGLCAGFFLMRSNPKSIAWMDRVVSYLNPLIDDQISMRRNIQDEAEMSVHYLPRDLFPNGSAYFDLKIPQRRRTTPVMVHNNCIIGHRSKVERFKAYGLWFLEEQSSFPSNLPPTVAAVHSLRSHTEAIACLAFHKDILYSGSYDKTLRIWDPVQGKIISTKYLNKRGGVWDLQFEVAGDSTLLWTCSHDKLVQSWRLEDFSAVRSFDGHLLVVNSLAITPTHVYAGGDDGTVRSWAKSTGERDTIFKGHCDWVTKILVHGNVLFTASKDCTARAWYLPTGRCVQVYKHQDWVRGLVLQGDSLWTAAGSLIYSWDYKKGEVLRTLNTAQVTSALIVEGNSIIQGCENGEICLWKDFALTHTLRGHTDSISALALNKRTLASGSYDKKILLWEFPHS